jgi:hypothetical protein
MFRGRYTPKENEVTIPSPTGKDWKFESDGEDLVLYKWDGSTWVEAERTAGSE